MNKYLILVILLIFLVLCMFSILIYQIDKKYSEVFTYKFLVSKNSDIYKIKIEKNNFDKVQESLIKQIEIIENNA